MGQQTQKTEENELERKYLARVQDQMEKVATKENKMTEEVKKMLPIKLHLRSWQDKLKLKDSNEDSFEQRLLDAKEQKFDMLIEKLYAMEWNKLREDNRMEFNHIKSTVFKKIEHAQSIINNL